MPFSEGDAMDKIIVNGLKLYAYHGVNPEEKEDGQLFYFRYNRISFSLCSVPNGYGREYRELC